MNAEADETDAGEAAAGKIFPLEVRNAGGVLAVHLASFCVDAFPPCHRLLVLLVSRPGPFRPELVTIPAGDNAAAMRWLIGAGSLSAVDAESIVAAAGRIERLFQERSAAIAAAHAGSPRPSQGIR